MSASPLKIDQKITAWSVQRSPKGDMTAPAVITYNRGPELEGSTYKIKPPQVDCAMYITINHKLLDDGSLRPLEIFINSKKADQHQWIAGLTRMMSAVFHKPGPIEFVIEEMEEVYDPSGGYWAEGTFQKSILSHIGSILRKHCEKIGAIEAKGLSPEQRVVIEEKIEEAAVAGIEMTLCPDCREVSMLMQSGCMTCTNCGESKCG